MMQLRKQGLALVVLLLAAFGFFTPSAHAASYGEGSYGEGIYNEGGTTSTSGDSSSPTTSSTTTAPVCGDPTPGAVEPWLYGAIPQNSNSILIYFTESPDPVTHYALEFGTESGKYQFAADNIGSKGSRTYLVESLQPNTIYYFRVRAGNGCATGEWSNEISAKTKGLVSFNQLDITESVLEPVEPEPEAPPSSCQVYTVQPGDSLWNIAASELGDGDLYTDLIEQNKDKYPSLATSTSLEVGWQLSVCPVPESQETEEPGEEAALKSYIVNVNVFDADQNPVGGATVAIHSEVQEMVTDERGTARFENVEAGEHRVLVAYDGYEGEQSIFLTGDTKEFNLTITVERKSVLTSPVVMGIIGSLGVIIFVLLVLLVRARARQ